LIEGQRIGAVSKRFGAVGAQVMSRNARIYFCDYADHTAAEWWELANVSPSAVDKK
jgi:hypothetical protein